MIDSHCQIGTTFGTQEALNFGKLMLIRLNFGKLMLNFLDTCRESINPFTHKGKHSRQTYAYTNGKLMLKQIHLCLFFEIPVPSNRPILTLCDSCISGRNLDPLIGGFDMDKLYANRHDIVYAAMPISQ